MPHRPRHRHIRQLPHLRCTSQHQPTATHIPAPHKLPRKHQPLPKNLQQRLDIFRRGHAPQQHNLALTPHALRKQPRIPFQRHTILRRPRSNISARNLQQIRQPKHSIRRHQPARSRNHNNPRQPTRRRSMRPRIRQLPPKIQPTDKAKNFPERQPLFAKPHRQRKRRPSRKIIRARTPAAFAGDSKKIRLRRSSKFTPCGTDASSRTPAFPPAASPTRALAPGVCPTNRIDFTRFPVPQPRATKKSIRRPRLLQGAAPSRF